jgi:hypothetical protein
MLLRYGTFFWDHRGSESPRRRADKLACGDASQDGERRLWAVRPQGSERWTQFWN